MELNNIGLRIKKLRELKKLTQIEFSNRIGIKQANLSHIENKGEKISVEIINRIISNFNINANWLIEGILPISKSEEIEKQRAERKLIPFYDDVSTIGGNNDILTDTNNNNASVSEWIDAGDWFPDATAAIRHYGDSMVEYPSGSILALKRVLDRRLIINGRNYVIETTEFRITKQLQDDGSGFIMAYSSNKETYPDGRQIHSPIKIPKETIRNVDLVLGCVTKEYSNGAIAIKK